MNNKSSRLIIISCILLFFIGYSFILNAYLFMKIQKDAEAINQAGIIRGSIQRISKLELGNVETTHLINEIDTVIDDFQSGKFSVKGDSKEFEAELKSLDEGFQELKILIASYRNSPSEVVKKAFLVKSEDLWKKSCDTVLTAQLASERKVESFKSICGSLIAALVLIIAVIAFIKGYVKDKLEVLANFDPLTKVYNRHFYNEYLEKEIARAQRYESALSLIMFDIDHFKRINDTYGHSTGDYVLKELAIIIKGAIRRSDILARIGGEEFIVVAPSTSLENAYTLAEKLRKTVEDYDFKTVGGITISLGVTQFVKADTIDSIYRRTDTALYSAKSGGRNRTEVA